ncbi:DUF5680 domain-containing protein [Ferroplasma sp.]|uniref:DUF5680 domain-containing protein n=1 Tax=Ferroplasma sp. TaxID=2591003 RepID=UPI00262FC01E|nr:DUF5680 domain-containing protein [Ferroplasma sp.]MCL4452542.1 DUF5680 domain-containing protein [Candidatus Thermoplasmatota archaeon]
MDTEALLDFIVSAKKHTYASGSKGMESSIPGSREFNFREGIMEYRDIYFGMSSFNGIETVYSNGVPVWGMVYSGGVTDESVDTDEIYKFLKHCLCLISKEAPFRGPKSYSDGIYLYDNDFSGDIFYFMGYEKIDEGENTLYELHYSGGNII